MEIVVHKPDLPRQATSRDVLDRLASFLRLNVSEGDASEKTVKAYMTHVGQFAQWAWEQGLSPGLATQEDLAHYRRHLVERGYSRSTVRVKLSAIRRFFQAAISYGIREDNPAEGVRPPREHTTRRDQLLERYLSREQMQALLNAPKADLPRGKRDRAILALMYYHGLRVSEVVALNLDDIKAGEHWRLHIAHSKGAKSRVVILTKKSLDILRLYLGFRARVEGSEQALFVSASNRNMLGRLTVKGAQWIVKKYMRQIGIDRPGIGPHAIRHAHASHALAGGADLNALAAELGHANIQTTTVYTHVVDAVEQNPAEFL